MKVFKIPKKSERSSSTKKEYPLYSNKFNYTCECNEKISIDQDQVVFKSIEFYCKKCGKHHKVDNPLFFSNKEEK